MPTYATMDVGSNSVLLYVVRVSDRGVEVLADQADLTRLGEGLRVANMLQPEPMARTLAALKGMREHALALGAESIAAVGTMALRTATNSAAFLAQVKSEAGLEVEVIPGEEEARLSYMAVRSGLPASAKRVIVFDVGGGSTEFIYGDDDQIERRFSLNVGALRLTEEHLHADPVTPAERASLQAALLGELAPVAPEAADALVGMGGAITNLVAVKHQLAEYDADVVQGARLSVEDVDGLIDMLQSRSLAERARLPGLQPKRADTILAGAAVVRQVMAQTGRDEVLVSVRGIRHGLMLDRFGVRN